MNDVPLPPGLEQALAVKIGDMIQVRDGGRWLKFGMVKAEGVASARRLIARYPDEYRVKPRRA